MRFGKYWHLTALAAVILGWNAAAAREVLDTDDPFAEPAIRAPAVGRPAADPFAPSAGYATTPGVAVPNKPNVDVLKAPTPEVKLDEKTQKRITHAIQDLASSSPDVVKAAMAELEAASFGAVPDLRKEVLGGTERAARAREVLDRIFTFTHIVVDAEGKPMAGAKLSINLPSGITIELTANAVGHVTVPPQPPTGNTSLNFGRARVKHADYSEAEAIVDFQPGRYQVTAPVAKPDAKRLEKAVQGIVVDSDKKPVAGARVHCWQVVTTGRGSAANDRFGTVWSGPDGKFILAPTFDPDVQPGQPDMITADSRFLLRIDPPEGSDYFPVGNSYSAKEKAEITLPVGKREHKFAYEGPGGEPVDAKKAATIRIQYSPTKDGATHALEPRYTTAANKLATGFYHAQGQFKFLPIEITGDDQPRELTFRRPPNIVYTGRAVDGATGKPIAGAFVITYQSTSNETLSEIAPEEWKALHGLKARVGLEDPTVQILRRVYGLKHFQRADEDGKFELTQLPEDDFYGLVVCDQDRVPVRMPKFKTKPDDKSRVEFGDVPLFAAGKALVKPVFTQGVSMAVSPHWKLAEKDQPEWIGKLKALNEGKTWEAEYSRWMKINEKKPVFVPSGVTLAVEFRTPYDDRWHPKQIDTQFKLDTAESKDLGDLTFLAGLPLKVTVVDESGKPVAGVPVHRMYDGTNIWSAPKLTNAAGEVAWLVAPGSKGKFGVLQGFTGAEKQKHTDFDAGSTEPVKVTIPDEVAKKIGKPASAPPVAPPGIPGTVRPGRTGTGPLSPLTPPSTGPRPADAAPSLPSPDPMPEPTRLR